MLLSLIYTTSEQLEEAMRAQIEKFDQLLDPLELHPLELFIGAVEGQLANLRRSWRTVTMEFLALRNNAATQVS